MSVSSSGLQRCVASVIMKAIVNCINIWKWYPHIKGQRKTMETNGGINLADNASNSFTCLIQIGVSLFLPFLFPPFPQLNFPFQQTFPIVRFPVLSICMYELDWFNSLSVKSFFLLDGFFVGTRRQAICFKMPPWLFVSPGSHHLVYSIGKKIIVARDLISFFFTF